MIGRVIGRYEILERIGAGGMGTVYKARDRELGRFVAVKQMSGTAGHDHDQRRRFLQEARAASALNHPNIVTIHEIVHTEDTELIVMEYVDGKPLSALISAGPLPLEQALGLGRQISAALGAAHEAAIIHRDVKPANILVTSSGLVKVVDFGLAKSTQPASENEATATQLEPVTGRGVVLGTVAYMSPEQAEGKPLDPRTDVFSLGVVLFEMLSGKQPFRGESQLSTITAILRDPLPPLDLPAPLRTLLEKSVAKKREDRPNTAAEVRAQLEAFRPSQPAIGASRLAPATLRLVLAGLAILALAIAIWAFQRASKRNAASAAIPRIEELSGKGDLFGAYDLAMSVASDLPDDPTSQRIFSEAVVPFELESEPPGATISIKPYQASGSAWRKVAVTPVKAVPLPAGQYLFRAEKDGFDGVYGYAERVGRRIAFRLLPKGVLPAGMVAVSPGAVFFRNFSHLGAAPKETYFIDTHEVTNRQFKEFVDAGGYTNRAYWSEPILKQGRTLPWEEAVAAFRDKTGRPGPASWEGGTFPPGLENHPVSGVSWYEAAAYARFRGKQLPTLPHWLMAADPGNSVFSADAGNFSGAGPVPVGSLHTEGTFGTRDMAGNVKEWCWNDDGNGLRYIMGGAFTEPSYRSVELDAQDPLDRSLLHGFRCMIDPRGPDKAALQTISPRRLDASRLKPVSDEVFEAYRSLYRYDRSDLASQQESVDDSNPDWKREKVTFAAAYDGQRVPAFVFIPRNAKPPYQSVLFIPGANALRIRSSATLQNLNAIDFIVRSGRVVIYPVIKGSYERFSPNPRWTPVQARTNTIHQVLDIQRSVDYLTSRPDIDPARIGFVGLSYGGQFGPLPLAIESRFRAAVLVIGGLIPARIPETDRVNYLPRVRLPVLTLNGRFDFTFPLETAQKPFFELLGTPAKDKRAVLFNTGHGLSAVRSEWIRETLDWLDRYLGPVQR